MDVRNCRGCGRLFNYLGGGNNLCPNCMKALDEKFSQVKEYIYDNPEASIQQIMEDNKVSVQQIKKWIREERLCFSEHSPIGIECESCGKMIKTGRFCSVCKEKLANTLHSAYQQEPEETRSVSDSPKMRFLDN